MDSFKPFESVAEFFCQGVLDHGMEVNRLICDGRMTGPDNIYKKLLTIAGFTPTQLRVVEYLMNHSTDGAFAGFLEQLDALGRDTFDLRIKTSNGTFEEVPLDDPEWTLSAMYILSEGWRERFSTIGRRQAELATSLGVTPEIQDTSTGSRGEGESDGNFKPT
jgi:hypothetical protein